MNARTRVAASAAAGVVVLVPALILLPWQVADLLGWDVLAASFVGSVFITTRGKDPEQTREASTREDDSRVGADAVLIGASLASLVGVVIALLYASGAQGAEHTLVIAVAFTSVVLSWSAVHTVYTLQYARLYYTHGGGIDWHGRDAPDFGDFAYVALTIGMTFQVSDTDIRTKAIRKVALRHAVLSYLFGVVIVATTINVVASLLAK